MFSQGPYSYNRFSEYDKLFEGKGELPDFIKDKMKDAHDKEHKKDDKKSDCGCDHKKDKKDKKEVKEEITKDMVISHLIDNNYVNNEVSAEAMFNHISDEFLEEIESVIEEGFKPFPAAKVANQANKAFGKEQSAVKAGDQAGANKQMQRRIAMTNPAGRKAQLSK